MLCTLIGAIILSINIQVDLNMHLYDDIGDASSSLRGSTSSWWLGTEHSNECTALLVVWLMLLKVMHFSSVACLNAAAKYYHSRLFQFSLPIICSYAYFYIYIYILIFTVLHFPVRTSH